MLNLNQRFILAIVGLMTIIGLALTLAPAAKAEPSQWGAYGLSNYTMEIRRATGAETGVAITLTVVGEQNTVHITETGLDDRDIDGTTDWYQVDEGVYVFWDGGTKSPALLINENTWSGPFFNGH